MPHNGCPHQCSFCNQKSITGQAYQPNADDIKRAILTAINSLGENTKDAEIAFFGGSFTAIDRDYMVSLLECTSEYIDRFHGIRISTRPDYIDDEVLTLLKSYKVTSIELGAQSMCDEVLCANERGHTSFDVENASKLIKKHGFSLGLQMMTGLYKSTHEFDIYTAKRFAELSPDTVRIYPTIVMKNTKLEQLYLDKSYVPDTLDEAVILCSKLLTYFSNKQINVIRLGLHYSDSLSSDMVAGPYHPSFREMCESRILLDKLMNLLKDTDKKRVSVRVSPKCVSKLVGNSKRNIAELSKLGYEIEIIQDKSIADMDLSVL